jgi:hypothetical protein
VWVRSIHKCERFQIYVDIISKGKHIVGIVKEKSEAQREYKEAVEQGHGAYLLEKGLTFQFLIDL